MRFFYRLIWGSNGSYPYFSIICNSIVYMNVHQRNEFSVPRKRLPRNVRKKLILKKKEERRSDRRILKNFIREECNLLQQLEYDLQIMRWQDEQYNWNRQAQYQRSADHHRE